MRVDLRQGQHPGDWKLSVSTQGWGESARLALLGAERGGGDIIGGLLSARAWQDHAVLHSEWHVVTAINDALGRIQQRIDEGLDLLCDIEGDDVTVRDVLRFLDDLICLCVWLYSSALESLSQGNIERGVHAFGRSMQFHGRYQALMDMMKGHVEAPPTGPAHALAHRTDQMLKPGWLDHCRSVIQSGKAISQLADLLDVEGYDSCVTRLQPRTLKKWAREVGVTFKPGRRK